MPVGHLFFSFTGRINRGKYWLAVLVYVVVLVVSTLLLAAASLDSVMAWADYDFSNLGFATILLFVIEIGVFISQLSVIVKRLHDRDKSGWWVLVFGVLPGVLGALAVGGTDPGDFSPDAAFPILALVAAGLGLWGLIELGFLRGTAGPNRFGTDPLAIAEPRYPGAPLR